jgi:hypothetical protein
MTDSGKEREFPTHRLAWDGFSFQVPLDWDLSFYDFQSRVSSLRMEDDAAIRMQMEWHRPPRPVGLAHVKERYAAMARQMNALAVETQEVKGLPAGWGAFIYLMPDRRRLAICFWLAPEGRFFCFFRLHIDMAGGRYAERVLRLLTSSFELHAGPVIPWAVYDVALALHRDFHLEWTALQAGQKLLAFQWRLRRLLFWQFSLADMILKKRELYAWAADFLNRYKGLRGPRFVVTEGGIKTEKRHRYWLGHHEEIGRWCFQYQVACRHVPERNIILLTVFNYRRKADLEKPQFTFETAPRGELA